MCMILRRGFAVPKRNARHNEFTDLMTVMALAVARFSSDLGKLALHERQVAGPATMSR
jgi:hypothetical protein